MTATTEIIRYGPFGAIVWDTLTGATRRATQEDLDDLPVGDDLTSEEFIADPVFRR